MADLTGRIIQNRYKVEALIGRGGMAEVYQVYDNLRSIQLAMKVLREDLTRDKIFLRRFQREAQTLAKLQHKNIVRFYGLVQDSMEIFMLMDFIQGESLRDMIFRSTSPFSMQQVMDIMQPVSSALHYAHQMGIVHCDVKPGNILVDRHGDVMVTDFGIARMMDTATSTLIGVGTPAYMAPELIMGKDPLPQSDIYSLGVILYELLTAGERPFTGELAQTTGNTSAKVQWEHLHLPVPSPRQYNPGISDSVEAILMQCLSKNPNERYANPSQIVQALINASGNPNNSSSPNTSLPKETTTQSPQKIHDNKSNKKNQTSEINKNKGVRFVQAILLILSISVIFLSISFLKNRAYRKKAVSNAHCQIAYVSNQNNWDDEIFVMESDGSNQYQLTHNLIRDHAPSWSPDGKRIAYVSSRIGDEEIFVINADGSNQSQLTHNKEDDNDPDWSPDGKQIVFSSNDSSFGSSEIFIMDADGSNRRQITNNDYDDTYPSWSPDGEKIVFISNRNEGYEVFVMDASGSNQYQLTNNEYRNSDPSWSPDGTQIAYYSGRYGHITSNNFEDEIFIMDSDGSNQYQLTNNDFADRSPVWSPNGRQIACFSENQVEGLFHNWYVVIMDADGSNQQILTEENSDSWEPAWSPICKY